MIIGNHPGHINNLYLACGFSGHGLMHAPAVGCALTELILYGEYRTIDLARMGYQRRPPGSIAANSTCAGSTRSGES